MSGLFTYAEGSLMVRLLIAHFLTDFFLQSANQVRDKNLKGIRSSALWVHIATTVVVAWVFVFQWHYWPQMVLLGSTHLLIDLAKRYIDIRNRKPYSTSFQTSIFLIDQLLHITVLIVLWLWMISGWERMVGILRTYLPQYSLLLYVLGYLIVLGPVGYLIRFLTVQWADDLDQTNDGLKNAGMWIGCLERVLVLTLVLMHQFTAIGFLVTAKSLLRLIDRPEPAKVNTGQSFPFSARKHTEYVLIGTFLSFGFAILAGLCINWLLHL
jgi:hypothetical protein